jgi:AhpD family alkylhydroperoxidase
MTGTGTHRWPSLRVPVWQDPRDTLHRERIPAVFEGYGARSIAVFTNGALDANAKGLIALAMQCDGCMASHDQGAARRGATAGDVAILLNGEPGAVRAPRAYAAFEEFAAKR